MNRKTNDGSLNLQDWGKFWVSLLHKKTSTVGTIEVSE